MGHGVRGRAAPQAYIDEQTAAAVADTLQALAAPSRLRSSGGSARGRPA